MASFRKYGGTQYSATNNVSRSNILNSEQLNINGVSGQLNTKETFLSNVDMSGNSVLHIGGLYFQDGTSMNTAMKQGATGAQGLQGVTGSQGVPGSGGSGSIGPQGATGPTGATGGDGATGSTGPAGATGATGAQGPAGSTNAHDSVHAATTADIGGTYAAGTIGADGGYGIGATITSSLNERLSVDGHNMNDGERVLCWLNAGATTNGIYVVTDQGQADPGGRQWIITRATDYDNNTAEQVQDGDFTLVISCLLYTSPSPRD